MSSSLTFEYLDSQIESKRSLYGRFSLSPLNPGQGITLGNSLRRTLLSDLTGVAITYVQILGINHEFATVPGIRESVLEILLNLKQIVFKIDSSFDALQVPQRAFLHFEGPGNVLAEMIQLPNTVKLVDPSQHIATIVSETTSFDLVLTLEKGEGYQLADIYKGSLISLDSLPLDAIFMPVTRVNYTVEKFSLHDLYKEKLLLEVWTNGSIQPRQALNDASHSLINLLTSLKDTPFENPIPSFDSLPITNLNQILIEELELSVRAYNCLKRANIHSISDLLGYSAENLLEIKNFGQKSADEVIEALKSRFGISLHHE